MCLNSGLLLMISTKLTCIEGQAQELIQHILLHCFSPLFRKGALLKIKSNIKKYNYFKHIHTLNSKGSCWVLPHTLI